MLRSKFSRIKYSSTKDLKVLSPQFVTGFTDGEGCFALRIFGLDTKSKGESCYCSFSFKLGVNIKDKDILEKIQRYFGGLGAIHESKTSSMITYQVSDSKGLGVIIDHFIKYPLLSYKAADFNLFKEAYSLFIEKAHLTHEGLIKLLSIKASLNKGISEAGNLFWDRAS